MVVEVKQESRIKAACAHVIAGMGVAILLALAHRLGKTRR